MYHFKIIVAISIVLLFPFSLLIISEQAIGNNIEQDITVQEIIDSKFFSNDFSNNRTMFVVGSSQTGALNVTKINDIISSKIIDDEVPISVYNISLPGSTPFHELKHVDLIISSHPEMIFYGISYRDFHFPVKSNTDNFSYIDLQSISSKALSSSVIDIVPSNPQLLTRVVLRDIFQDKQKTDVEINTETIPKTPFYKYQKNPTTMLEEELRRSIKGPTTWTGSVTQYKNINALEEYIKQVTDNDIKVVIFQVPLQKYYLKSLSASQIENMNKLIEDLEKKHSIKTYDFREKYSELDIWDTPSHVSYQSHITQYVQDVSEMILLESYR